MLETSRDTKEYIHIAIMLLVYIYLLYDESINCLSRGQCWLEVADDKQEPMLRDEVCDSVRPDINKGLVQLRCVYARRLCANDGRLFAVVSRGESAEC